MRQRLQPHRAAERVEGRSSARIAMRGQHLIRVLAWRDRTRDLPGVCASLTPAEWSEIHRSPGGHLEQHLARRGLLTLEHPLDRQNGARRDALAIKEVGPVYRPIRFERGRSRRSTRSHP